MKRKCQTYISNNDICHKSKYILFSTDTQASPHTHARAYKHTRTHTHSHTYECASSARTHPRTCTHSSASKCPHMLTHVLTAKKIACSNIHTQKLRMRSPSLLPVTMKSISINILCLKNKTKKTSRVCNVLLKRSLA